MKPKKRGLKKKILIGVAVVLAVVVILGLLSVDNAKAAYQLALEGKDHIINVQDAVAKQDLKVAAEEIRAAEEKFSQAKEEFDSVRWAVVVPYVGQQITAAGELIDSAVDLTSTMSKVVDSGLEVLSPIQSEDITNFGQLTTDQKGEALGKLAEAEPVFNEAKKDIVEAQDKLANMSTFGVRPEIVEARDLILENLPEVQNFINDALLAARILPRIGGHPDEQQFLFVSQNPHELRASGGFIGTFGIMKINEGEISEFTTTGVYNLDDEATVKIEPPDYLREYLKSKTWFMRDANTCVGCMDFAVASRKILELYELEKGHEDFAGVISITSPFLEDLLEITGPVEVPGYPYTFDQENVTETLQEHVEVNYAKMGIPMENRQSIINDLSSVLLSKIFTLPKEKWPILVGTLQDAFHEKHAMVYTKDTDTQAVLRQEGWTSELNNSWQRDYVAIADNNMAALKTDRVMDRTANYSVDLSNPKAPVAKLQITYNNTGRFTNFTTRYRTWTQIYVPTAAELLSYEGAEITDKQGPTGEIREEIDPNSGRKVFSYFKSIEPGTQETITIEYQLPPTVIEDNTYALLFQKQPGTISNKLNVNVTGLPAIEEALPEDGSSIVEDTVSFDSNLLIDREFLVKY
ncbi:DUF4012 domain-containing protein [Patescibacteria group bacterium]